ncbi:MAG: glycosyltransferase [Rhizobiaceae bacterium]|nr:glycosyltransferase [Rhizobiaceae bacterium]MCZ8352526.1 glycosyltransferase [Rhizobium sp.]
MALDNGYATDIDYIGYKSSGLPATETHAARQQIYRLGPEPAAPGSSRLVRASSLPRWSLACLRQSRLGDASLIIAHSLAALPVSVRLARQHRLPLLYDAHELETERAGWSRPICKMAKMIESHLIRKADHVTLVNESIRDWYLAAYPGIDTSVVRNVPLLPATIGKSALRKTLNLQSDALIYVYCGALAADRGLSELIEVFRDLGRDRHLVLIGYGHAREALAHQARGLCNVHFHDAVPQSELITLLEGADVGIIVPKAVSLSYEFSLPNKLFEYAAAGLAVITGGGPELERFAREYPAAKRAILSMDSLRGAIIAWSREELDRVKPAIKAYQIPSWQTEQQKLITAFDKAIESGRRRWA